MVRSTEQVAENGTAKASRADAFTPWYAVWCCAFLLWLDVVDYLDQFYNFYIMIGLVILPPLLILAGALLVSLTINIFKLRWRRILSLIAAPVIALMFAKVITWLGVTPALVRLELSKSNYMAEVDALSATDGPRFKCWDWGATGGVAVVTIFRALVYDESDQLALPRSAWSQAWILKADAACGGTPLHSFIHQSDNQQNHPSTNYQVGVGRLNGHFYVATELFQ